MDSDLKRIEEKLNACLTLMLKVVTANDFRYNLETCSPLWLRAMTAAQSLASSVSIDAAKLLPECSDERILNLIHRAKQVPTEMGQQPEPVDLLAADKNDHR